MIQTSSDNLTLAQVHPDKQSRPAAGLNFPDGDWLCAGCLNPIASEGDRFHYEGNAEFTFANPEGVQFSISTFSQTTGCQEAGLPTLEYTWFQEHAWSFCVCERCQMHLGWFYAGPNEFVGLIRDRLVRGRSVWN